MNQKNMVVPRAFEPTPEDSPSKLQDTRQLSAGRKKQMGRMDPTRID